MAEAEVKLASTLSEEGARDRLNIENLEEGQQVSWHTKVDSGQQELSLIFRAPEMIL